MIRTIFKNLSHSFYFQSFGDMENTRSTRFAWGNEAALTDQTMRGFVYQSRERKWKKSPLELHTQFSPADIWG